MDEFETNAIGITYGSSVSRQLEGSTSHVVGLTDLIIDLLWKVSTSVNQFN